MASLTMDPGSVRDQLRRMTADRDWLAAELARVTAERDQLAADAVVQRFRKREADREIQFLEADLKRYRRDLASSSVRREEAATGSS